jgi:hypothetical protein
MRLAAGRNSVTPPPSSLARARFGRPARRLAKHPGGALVERKADVVGGKINRADTIGLWPPRGKNSKPRRLLGS